MVRRKNKIAEQEFDDVIKNMLCSNNNYLKCDFCKKENENGI